MLLTAGRLWNTLLGYGSNFELRGLLEYRTISWPRDVRGSTWREVAAHAEFDGGVKTAEQFFRSDGGKQWAPLEDLKDAHRYFNKIQETGVLGLFPLGQSLQGEEQLAPQVQTEHMLLYMYSQAVYIPLTTLAYASAISSKSKIYRRSWVVQGCLLCSWVHTTRTPEPLLCSGSVHP